VPETVSGKPSSTNQIGETIELVRSYVKQETVGPLKGAGRWIGFGVAAAVALAAGLSLLLLGLLRLLQTEAADTFDGNWSWAPYAIVVAACGVIIGIAVSRIRKDTLQRKEPS